MAPPLRRLDGTPGLGLAASYLASLADGVTDANDASVAVAAVGSLTLIWFGYRGACATRHVRLKPDPREE